MLRTAVTATLGAALVIACGHSAVNQPVGPGTHLDAFPVGPPLATPGEKFSYKLQLQGVDLATYDFVMGEVVDEGGKKALVAQSHAKAVGLVQMVANVDDIFTSWVDVTTGRPLRWTSDEFAVHGKQKERTEAHIAQRQGNVVPVDFHMDEAPPVPEPQTVNLPETWDYNAMMIALRSWDAPRNTSVDAEVFRSRYIWHLTMTVGPKGKLTTELGELPALRLDGHVYKIDRSGKKVPDDERDFVVWISDDDGRVPLLITAKTDYGDVKLTITSYDPGTGLRLRQ